MRSRSARQSASTSAVLPLPTGPPMPTVNARAREVARAAARSRRWNVARAGCQCSWSCPWCRMVVVHRAWLLASGRASSRGGRAAPAQLESGAVCAASSSGDAAASARTARERRRARPGAAAPRAARRSAEPDRRRERRRARRVQVQPRRVVARRRRARRRARRTTGARWPRAGARTAVERASARARARRAAEQRPALRAARAVRDVARRAARRSARRARRARAGVVARRGDEGQRERARLPERLVDEALERRRSAASAPSCDRRLEPARVREAAGREAPSRRAGGGARASSHQNRE